MSAAHPSSIRLQAWVLTIGLVLMAIKFIAWRVTHSNAVLSDALESIVNVAAGAFALYSLHLAAKPRDREHPYGHGKVEFISAGAEGSLVAIAGVVIVYRAIQAWISGHEVHANEEGIVLVSAAGGLNMIMGLVLRSRGKRAHSLTLQASGTHLLSDAWSTIAMLIGLLLIKLTGRMWLDSLFALGFGVFILYQGMRMVRKSVSGIMDETDMAVAAQLVAILEENRRKEWIDIHNFRVITFGRTLHIDCHVTLPFYWSLQQAHDAIAEIEQLVNQRSGREVELFIHMDPCVPISCSICGLTECKERRSPFVKRVPWTLESALLNKKHDAV
jgi:cation diffusion facilitator family transporter